MFIERDLTNKLKTNVKKELTKGLLGYGALAVAFLPASKVNAEKWEDTASIGCQYYSMNDQVRFLPTINFRNISVPGHRTAIRITDVETNNFMDLLYDNGALLDVRNNLSVIPDMIIPLRSDRDYEYTAIAHPYQTSPDQLLPSRRLFTEYIKSPDCGSAPAYPIRPS
jgi:hypothetical protein